MVWILLWALMNSESMTSGSQEFNTKQACEKAASELRSIGFLRWGINDVVVCVPKGEL